MIFRLEWGALVQPDQKSNIRIVIFCYRKIGEFEVFSLFLLSESEIQAGKALPDFSGSVTQRTFISRYSAAYTPV
jgi:hypothetical protein